MEKVIIHKVYNLVNHNGDKLQLKLGLLQNNRDNGVPVPAIHGWRWSFEGKEIPMPVRSRTWFNGFPADTMLLWLAEHDWYVVTEVDMATGKANVNGLPEPEEAYTDEDFAKDETVFNEILKELTAQGKFGIAVQLYSYAHEVGHWTARQITREICGA